MNLYAYLQVKDPQKILFSSPFSELFKSKGYTFFEADQDSESFLFAQGSNFLQEAEHVVIHLDVEEGVSIRNLAHFFESLRKYKSSPFMVCQGQNIAIQNMIKALKKEVSYVLSEGEAFACFEDYFKSNSSASK